MKKFTQCVKTITKKVAHNKTLVAACALMVPALARTCVIWILGAEDAPDCMIEK